MKRNNNMNKICIESTLTPTPNPHSSKKPTAISAGVKLMMSGRPVAILWKPNFKIDNIQSIKLTVSYHVYKKKINSKSNELAFQEDE